MNPIEFGEAIIAWWCDPFNPWRDPAFLLPFALLGVVVVLLIIEINAQGSYKGSYTSRLVRLCGGAVRQLRRNRKPALRRLQRTRMPARPDSRRTYR